MIGIDWPMISDLFEPVGFPEAIRRLNEKSSEIDRDRPYGLSFGDLHHILDCYHNVGLRGEYVFELGGCLEKSFVEECIKPEGWHSVTSDIYDVDYQYNIDETSRPSIENTVNKSRNYYKSNLGILEYYNQHSLHNSDRKFTRVFSVAAFEHLKLPSLMIEKAYEMCKQGALLYSYFTPVWSAVNGHHWSYFPMILPPYIHLSLSHNEFIEWCRNELKMDLGESEIHAHQIYKSTRINRLSPREWNRVFENMSFRILALNLIGQKDLAELEPAKRERIVKSIGSNITCEGYRLIGKKD
tara:strand:- start:5053 stop:5946 length:894 start_codon:yes stop_codon:yes gene_type:complete